MLIEFITTNRATLIARTREKVAKRLAPRATKDELATGVPLFLDQLVETLRRPPALAPGAIEASAAIHGAARLSDRAALVPGKSLQGGHIARSFCD